jgi:predicted nucleic acid-binding protein
VKEPFVVDASVAIAWVHPAQATPKTDALLGLTIEGASIHAPALWPLEVSNALLILVRRKKLLEEERQSALRGLQGLSVVIDHEGANLAFTKLSAIAQDHRLSVYDAAYFELAARKRIALACKDGPLREAAVRAGLAVI